jgi:hypothetical protein
MRLRKKERERGRVAYGMSSEGILRWRQGGDEREGEKRLMREKGKECASFDFERERERACVGLRGG